MLINLGSLLMLLFAIFLLLFGLIVENSLFTCGFIMLL